MLIQNLCWLRFKAFENRGWTLSSLRVQLLFLRNRKGFPHRTFMDGVNQLSKSEERAQTEETHQEERDWIKHPGSRIHLLKHTLKPQPKNMNIGYRMVINIEQIHQQSGKSSSPVLDPTDALICICIFKDLERALSLVLVWWWQLR